MHPIAFDTGLLPPSVQCLGCELLYWNAGRVEKLHASG